MSGQGTWTDFFTGDEYAGGQELTFVRWLEEMPVLLKEGGFFVLDDRKYTNDVANPDQLKVVVTNGNGSYTLHEEQDGNRLDTVFVSKAGEGVQSVMFHCNTEMKEAALCIPPRKYKFVFSNILSGTATVLADGKACAAAVDDNGRLSVVIEGVCPNTKYEICVRFAKKADEKRKEALRKTITKLQMDNNEKNRIYERLCCADKAAYVEIVEQMPVPQIAKDRLIEIG